MDHLPIESSLLGRKVGMKLFFVFLQLGFSLSPYSRSKLIKNYQTLVRFSKKVCFQGLYKNCNLKIGDEMGMGLEEAIKKRDFDFDEYLPPQPERNYSDGHYYDFF